MISLGISYSKAHDSSACIARDGKLLFAVAEERLSRVKHDARFPRLAVKACLDFAGAGARDLDHICFGYQRPLKGFMHDLKCLASGQQPMSGLNLLITTQHFASMWHQDGGYHHFTAAFGPTKVRPRFVDHHLAHAISAYAFSGLEQAAVLVVDGRGAWEATSIWHGHDGRLDPVLTIPWPNSLGLFYAAFTEYLGFQPNSDEWKVMGLAPYGEPGADLHQFIDLHGDRYRVNARLLLGNGNGSAMAALASRMGGPARKPESEIDGRHKNIAYGVQELCEQAMLALVREAVARTGCRDLCLAGGVALNSKANGKILSSGAVDRLFVQPAAADDGVALGAALAPYLEGGGRLPLQAMRQVYLGPEFDNSDIEKALSTYKLRYVKLDNVASTAADLLAAGRILGWFQGRMEFGPRALGSRSILADPRDPEMNAKVNNAVKFREWWRPFAPSMLAEAAAEYLEAAVDSPFMIVTSQVKPEKRNVIPAVTHVDGSARPQTVVEEQNPLYWRTLKAFGERTGVPVLMNTSFNLRGEPIVNTPTDALRTFFSSGMDALVIGSYLVEK